MSCLHTSISSELFSLDMYILQKQSKQTKNTKVETEKLTFLRRAVPTKWLRL